MGILDLETTIGANHQLVRSAIRVLLVDDHQMVADAVSFMLEAEEDMDFYYCADSARALSVAARIKPTVILQDLVMPGIDGLTMLANYRQDPLLEAVPVIVLSSHDEAAVKDESFSAGSNDYLVKLPEKIELLARIRYHSRAYQEHQALQETIGKLQEAHEQLLQSEKMASIGQLAAGVAHEINNPVGFVNSNISTLGEYLKDIFSLVNHYQALVDGLPAETEAVSKVKAFRQQIDWDHISQDTSNLMQESKDGLQRVKQIVNDLKDFSHVDQAEWQWANLHKGLDATLNIVNSEIKYKAEVLKEYGDLPEVQCIPSQINQVILNMLVNASHAIKDRGEISIRTGTALQAGTIAMVEDPQWAWIQIRDNGGGMPADVLRRIFDPFYTTKPVGTGTGLGLSLSYGIIQRHHGKIDVDSKPGEGTCFTIWLPLRQADDVSDTMVVNQGGDA